MTDAAWSFRLQIHPLYGLPLRSRAALLLVPLPTPAAPDEVAVERSLVHTGVGIV